MDAAPIDHTLPLAAEVRLHQSATGTSNAPVHVLVRARPGEPLRVEPAPVGAALPAQTSSPKPDVKAQPDRRPVPQAQTSGESLAGRPASPAALPTADTVVHAPSLAPAPLPAKLPTPSFPEVAAAESGQRGLLPKLSRWWSERGSTSGATSRARTQAGDTLTAGVTATSVAAASGTPGVVALSTPMQAALPLPAELPMPTRAAELPPGFATGIGVGQMPSSIRASARPRNAAEVMMRVRNPRIALRAYPDPEAQIIGHLQQHTPVTVRGPGHGVWRRVDAAGLKGWVLESWLEASN